MGFPYISLTYTAFIGEDSSIFRYLKCLVIMMHRLIPDMAFFDWWETVWLWWCRRKVVASAEGSTLMQPLDFHTIHQQFVSLRFPHGTSLRWKTPVKLRWQAKRSCFTLKICEIPTINYLLPMMLPYIILKWEETYKFHTILLMEETLHHLGCIKPCKFWDKLHINWCRISSINNM